MSQEDAKVLKELKKEAQKVVPPALHPVIGRKLDDKATKELADQKREYGQLSKVADGLVAVKAVPTTNEARGRQLGERAKALIARRALVGLSPIRTSKELVIWDNQPVPNGEFAIIPHSMLRSDRSLGLAHLMTVELGSQVLYQAVLNVTDAAGGTTIPISPALSRDSPAYFIEVANYNANDIYITYDGEYDPITATTSGATAPDLGVGQWVKGATGPVTIKYMMRANPRVIAPAGAQDVGFVIKR